MPSADEPLAIAEIELLFTTLALKVRTWIAMPVAVANPIAAADAETVPLLVTPPVKRVTVRPKPIPIPATDTREFAFITAEIVPLLVMLPAKVDDVLTATPKATPVAVACANAESVPLFAISPTKLRVSIRTAAAFARPPVALAEIVPPLLVMPPPKLVVRDGGLKSDWLPTPSPTAAAATLLVAFAATVLVLMTPPAKFLARIAIPVATAKKPLAAAVIVALLAMP